MPITSMKTQDQAQTEMLFSDELMHWWGHQIGGSSLVWVMEQERMEDGVGVRNNNHDTDVY